MISSRNSSAGGLFSQASLASWLRTGITRSAHIETVVQAWKQSSDEFPDGRKSVVRRQHHTRAGSEEAR
ncbi:hypothetical protein ACFQ9Z_33275 [Streptomyces sp. NPDC056580]|uniref:hypothetical protein n=1 Tax=Streptomyces sp. NPDC056580 TaxID=3345872 RepID=UPI0036C5AD2D